jgi:hypothetical protein
MAVNKHLEVLSRADGKRTGEGGTALTPDQRNALTEALRVRNQGFGEILLALGDGETAPKPSHGNRVSGAHSFSGDFGELGESID